jgi:hypothetical protein
MRFPLELAEVSEADYAFLAHGELVFSASDQQRERITGHHH